MRTIILRQINRSIAIILLAAVHGVPQALSADNHCLLNQLTAKVEGETPKPPSSAAVKASMAQTRTFKLLKPYEQESRMKIFDQRDQFSKEVQKAGYNFSSMKQLEKRKYLMSVKGLTETTRVAAQSATSVGDLVSGQALAKEALSYYEKILEHAPELVDSPSDRDRILSIRIYAGDIEGAAKDFVRNAQLDFHAEGKRNATAALDENFKFLKAQAEAGPNPFVLKNENGHQTSLATGLPIAATNASGAYLQQIHELKVIDKILETKPAWLGAFDYARERARIQSLIRNAKSELNRRGYHLE